MTVYDTASRKRIRTLSAPAGYYFVATAFGNGGRNFAATFGRSGVFYLLRPRLWGEDEFQTLPHPMPPKPGGKVDALAFSGDGKSLWTSSGDCGTAIRWTVPEGKEVAAIKWPARAVQAAAFSPDCRSLAQAEGSKVSLMGLATGKVEKTFEAKIIITDLIFSRDGKRLLMVGAHPAGDRGSFEVHDIEGGKPLMESDHAKVGYHFSGFGFGPDDRTVVTTSYDGRITRWRSAKDRAEWQMPGAIHSAALARDGRYLITGNGNRTVYVFRLDGPAAEFRQPRKKE